MRHAVVDRSWAARLARVRDRLDPRQHFCFACDRHTLHRHRRHQATVARALSWLEENA